MKARFVIILWLCLATPALAGDFWKAKPYQQWTKEEVRRVLTDSPWARPDLDTRLNKVIGAQPYSFFSGAGSPASREGGLPSLSGAERSEGIPTGGGFGDTSRASGSQPEGPMARYLVVWSSAATVRKALAPIST